MIEFVYETAEEVSQRRIMAKGWYHLEIAETTRMYGIPTEKNKIRYIRQKLRDCVVDERNLRSKDDYGNAIGILADISTCVAIENYADAHDLIEKLLMNMPFLQSRIYFPLMNILNKVEGVPETPMNTKLKDGLTDKEKADYCKRMLNFVHPKIDTEEFFKKLNTERYAEFMAECERYKRVYLERIRFIEKAIWEDINSSYISAPFYGTQAALVSNVIPKTYRDEKGKEHTLEYESFRDFYLSGVNFIVAPQELTKISDSCETISQEGFIEKEENRMCRYFIEMDFAIVDNGNHSSTAAHLHGTGCVRAEAYSLKKLFEHVYTDGVNWYNRHNSKKLSKGDDFRVCTLFEIARYREEWLELFYKLRAEKEIR